MEWVEKKKREWELLKYLWPEKGWGWRIRNILNFVDDPVDDIKHKLHGIEFRGRTFYLPSWMMRGSGDKNK